jgi:hypothetical protein
LQSLEITLVIGTSSVRSKGNDVQDCSKAAMCKANVLRLLASSSTQNYCATWTPVFPASLMLHPTFDLTNTEIKDKAVHFRLQIRWFDVGRCFADELSLKRRWLCCGKGRRRSQAEFFILSRLTNKSGFDASLKWH